MQWTTAIVAAGIGATTVRGETISMVLTTDTPTVCTGDLVEIDFILVSDGRGAEPFDTTDVIVGWDPAHLELVGHDDTNADAVWFLSGFLNDPDGVNDDLTDGDAIYSALAQPGNTVAALPSGTTITTLQFLALADIALTEVEMRASVGTSGESRVLLAGTNLTGALGAPVVGRTCPADCAVPCDGVVDVTDMLALFRDWGQSGTPCDIDEDGIVDIRDLLELLMAWGPC